MQRYVRKSLILLTILAMVGLPSLFSASVLAQDQGRVKIEALGFFSHFPMRQTRKVIEDTCAKFGDKVELTLYDETRAEGQKFMKEKGLSGHIPMRLYINGNNTFIIDEKTVSFSDFVDDLWTAAELEKAITLTLAGADVSTADMFVPVEERDYTLIIVSVLTGAVIIAITGFYLFRPKRKAKGKV